MKVKPSSNVYLLVSIVVLDGDVDCSLCDIVFIPTCKSLEIITF